LIFFGLLFLITSFTQNNYQGVHGISPEVLKAPVQEEIKKPEVIRFQNEDGRWELTPLDDYEISGLIVSKVSYDLPTLYHTLFLRDTRQHAWPFDFALVWGSNVTHQVYKHCTFFSDVGLEGRRAHVFWEHQLPAPFHGDEFSNNHLIIHRKDLKDRASELVVGDQIKIKGKLVKFRLQVLEADRKSVAFEDAGISSRSRLDNGCEVIYVEDIQILKKANRISRTLFRISKVGFLGMIFLIFALWLYEKRVFFAPQGNRDTHFSLKNECPRRML
jgi:hypothetical protein